MLFTNWHAQSSDHRNGLDLGTDSEFELQFGVCPQIDALDLRHRWRAVREQRLHGTGAGIGGAMTVPYWMRGSFVLLLAGLCTSSRAQTAASGGTITTYAGPPDTVNGAQATTQFLDLPVAVRSDNAAGFYVVSRDRVYRVGGDGALRRIAGTGVTGFSGDGGPATLAQLNDLTRDRSGRPR
jgi:hypothetical protein